MNVTIKEIDMITQAITEEFLASLKSSRRLTCNQFRFDAIKDYRTRSIAKLDGLKLLPCISVFSKPYDLIQKSENAIDLAFLVELDSFPKGTVPSYDHLDHLRGNSSDFEQEFTQLEQTVFALPVQFRDSTCEQLKQG